MGVWFVLGFCVMVFCLVWFGLLVLGVGLICGVSRLWLFIVVLFVLVRVCGLWLGCGVAWFGVACARGLVCW